eukprot:15359352-Ditylum_brightwellii.AAC.2
MPGKKEEEERARFEDNPSHEILERENAREEEEEEMQSENNNTLHDEIKEMTEQECLQDVKDGKKKAHYQDLQPSTPNPSSTSSSTSSATSSNNNSSKNSKNPKGGQASSPSQTNAQKQVIKATYQALQKRPNEGRVTAWLKARQKAHTGSKKREYCCQTWNQEN